VYPTRGSHRNDRRGGIAAVLAELPLAWTVRSASDPEQAEVAGLLDSVLDRGFAAQVAVLDKSYGASRCTTCASHAASGP
jgi:hypothetical protein